MTISLAAPRSLEGPIIQSAVNFSEGRRRDAIDLILAAMSGESGAVLADWSADVDHNRMVATLLGDAGSLCRAILAASKTAVERIDLREHTGVHPRAGAVDVVPLVPIRGVTMDQCIEASLGLAQDLAEQLGLPVYLYERSARPGRSGLLPELRKGGFEGIASQPLSGSRAPDFGPMRAHPTAGIAIVGARAPLAAYNVNLGTNDPAAARQIAASIRRDRSSNPALTGARALGLSLPSRGITQVSMNLTQTDLTPIPPIFQYIARFASDSGVPVIESEIIGLIPESALGGRSPESILWHKYHPRQILQSWL